MIYLIHRGWGGRYTNYVSQNIKSISRMRRMELTSQEPANSGYKVVVSSTGVPVNDVNLKAILDNPRVSFYIGDSKGVPESVFNQADEIISVSSLQISHQLEAANLTAAIEKILINSNVTV